MRDHALKCHGKSLNCQPDSLVRVNKVIGAPKGLASEMELPGRDASVAVKEDGSYDLNSSIYPLSHRLSFALQERLQRARCGLHARLGDTSFDKGKFQIVPIPLSIPGLDDAFDGYRLVQISDIHLGQWITAERLDGVVDLVNGQNPDLVAITGDFVSYIFDEIADELARSLGGLHPRDGTVATLGNHDHWVGADNVRRFIRRGNVMELGNDVLTIFRGDAMLHIAGLDDIIANKHHLDVVLNKLPTSGPAILMVHEPDFADVSAGTGRFCLQLSGHSHGGQIVIPGLGTPIRSYLFRRYPLGRYQVGNMVQYTNRGLGTNLIRSRINCPPEITVFSLLSEKSKGKAAAK